MCIRDRIRFLFHCLLKNKTKTLSFYALLISYKTGKQFSSYVVPNSLVVACGSTIPQCVPMQIHDKNAYAQTHFYETCFPNIAGKNPAHANIKELHVLARTHSLRTLLYRLGKIIGSLSFKTAITCTVLVYILLECRH